MHRHPQSWDLTPVWDTHRLENSTAPAAPGGENPTGFFMASDFFSCSRIWIMLMGTEAIKGLGREQTAPNFAWAPWSISHSSLGPGTSKEFHGLTGFQWENREKINYIFIFKFFSIFFLYFFKSSQKTERKKFVFHKFVFHTHLPPFLIYISNG